MSAVQWTKCELAELNGIRSIHRYQAEVTPMDATIDGTHRVEFAPSLAVAYRTQNPAVVSLFNCATLSYTFTDDAAKSTWQAIDLAEATMDHETTDKGATVDRARDQFRLTLSTGMVTSKSNNGAHPYPDNVRDGVGVVDATEDGLSRTLLVQDAAGELHTFAFRRRMSGNTYSLLRGRTPYTLASERALRFTFEAVRAAQQWLLDNDVRLALNAHISVGERPQIRTSDEESEEAEEWFTVNKLD